MTGKTLGSVYGALALMQLELTPSTAAYFGRHNQFRMRNGDRKQRAFELCFPEREEIF